MRSVRLLLLLVPGLPLSSQARLKHVVFANDTIFGEQVKEYIVPLSGNITIDLYPVRVVRPMGITVSYLRSEDGKKWLEYKKDKMEAGSEEGRYKTKINCNKCKVAVSVKQLSVLEFRMAATKYP